MAVVSEARQGFLHEALVDGDGVLPLQRVEELLEDVVLQRGGELAFALVEAGVTVLLRRRQDLLELGDDLAVARRVRQSVVYGTRVSVRVDLGGVRTIKKKTTQQRQNATHIHHIQ